MDIKLIITIGIVLVVGILYAVKIFVLNKKKDPSETELEDVLEQYIEQIIQTGAKIISILQINREDYDSDEEYNLALAGHASIEVKKIITESDIPDYLKNALTTEVLTQFILRVFDINRGLLNEAVEEESELFKVKFMNSIQPEKDTIIFNDEDKEEVVTEVDDGKQTNITNELNGFYKE